MSNDSSVTRADEYLGRIVEDVFRESKLRELIVVFGSVSLLGELFSMAFPLYFEAVGLPVALLGVVVSVTRVVGVVASPVVGTLADTTDRMALVAGGAVVSAVGFGAFLFRPSGLFVVALAAVGVSAASLVMNTAITPAMNEAMNDGLEGIVWGVRDVAMYATAAGGLAAAGWTLDAVGHPSAALALALPVTGFIGLTAVRRIDAETIRPSKIDLDGLYTFDFRKQVASVSDRGLLYRFCAVELLATAGMGMAMVMLPVFATDLAFAGAAFLFVYSASRLFGAPMSVIGGIAADHLPRKWLFVGNYATEAAMLAAFAFADSRLTFLVGMGLFVIQTVFEPAVIAFFFDNFDNEEGGTVWGIKGSIHKATAVAAPAIGSTLYVIDPQLLFGIGAVVMTLGTLVAATLPRGDEVIAS